MMEKNVTLTIIAILISPLIAIAIGNWMVNQRNETSEKLPWF